MKRLVVLSMLLLTLISAAVSAVTSDVADLGGACDLGTGWDVAINDGNYGGLPEAEFCLVRGTEECTEEDIAEAGVVLYFEFDNLPVIIKHLDGISMLDAFDVYVDEVKIGTYSDDALDSKEEWFETSFPTTVEAGIHTVKIVSTDEPWAQCSSWGQLAVDWIEVGENQVPEFGTIALIAAALGGLTILAVRRH
jgi:hypothetical protein